MEWINNNLAQVLIFLGMGLLAFEIVVFGFATFVLFFVGLACVVVGAAMFIGFLPATFVMALTTVAVLSAILAAVLWQPLKNMQNKVDHTPVQSDVVGYTFTLESDVGPENPGGHRFSGVQWKVLCNEVLSAGTQVRVTQTDVGKLTVEKASKA